jgi:hypothetical protein
MSSDPIVDEIREIRERLASQFGFDVRAIAEDARRRDAAGDRKVVRLPPRQPPCEGTTPDVQRGATALLAEVWALSPDVRLGQLLAHLGFLGESHLGRGLGYIEDDELIAIMYRNRAELLARLQGTTNPAVRPAGAATSVSGSPTLPETR